MVSHSILEQVRTGKTVLTFCIPRQALKSAITSPINNKIKKLMKFCNTSKHQIDAGNKLLSVVMRRYFV
jgi:hypothetical protein